MFTPIYPGQILKAQDTIVIGVSGGVDSMALLHWLWANFSYRIIVAHFNHGLRKEAQKEEQLVNKVAKLYGAKIIVSKQNVKDYARKNKLGLEDAGRTLRYLFFHRVCKDYRAKMIMTAHHLDDHVETAILKMLRGASTSGMTGIEALSFYPSSYSKNRSLIFRPFITISKEDIKKYAKKHALKFLEDESNKDPNFKRNKVRHELIPKLKEINPSFLYTMQRNLLINADIADYMTSQANKWRLEVENGFNAYDFNQQHIAVRREILRQIYKDLYGHIKNISALMIEDVVELILTARTGKKKEFGHSWEVLIEYGRVYFRKNKNQKFFINDIFALNPQGETKFQKTKVIISESELDGLKEENRGLIAYFDKDKLRDKKLFVRFWWPGDRFHPKGMKGTKKLQDFFSDKKIAKRFRGRVPLLVTEDNDIVWVVGLRTSENYCAKPGSKNLVRVEIIDQNKF